MKKEGRTRHEQMGKRLKNMWLCAAPSFQPNEARSRVRTHFGVPIPFWADAGATAVTSCAYPSDYRNTPFCRTLKALRTESSKGKRRPRRYGTNRHSRRRTLSKWGLKWPDRVLCSPR